MMRVIKVGGRTQADPSLAASVAKSWGNGSHGQIVLVHGGGDEVSTLQAALGARAQFVNGRRVTSAQDIELVRMALSGSANKRLVARFVESGIDAVGVSGEDASLISALPMDAEVLGHVGAPKHVNGAFLRHLLGGGYMPVVSPVSRNASEGLGLALNVNGDDAAAAIAVSVGAEELTFVTDVVGVLLGGAVVPTLTCADAERLVHDGVAAGGMRAKVEAACAAVRRGVPRVRICDIAGIGDATRGTTVLCFGDPS
jgi:acetylglutamate kinase